MFLPVRRAAPRVLAIVSTLAVVSALAASFALARGSADDQPRLRAALPPDSIRHAGGLVGADLWLKHWMPLILDSPAYRDGHMLVIVTFDEGGVTVTGQSDVRSCCYEQAGPNTVAPGDIFGHATTNTAPGGGQVGAVLLSNRFIRPGTDNTTGQYNHYSALRSYEDLLGLDTGGADRAGHIGFAGAPGLVPFGPDVFNAESHDDDR
jgi:hypothetical protein